jgi:hypothetical protein
MFAASRLVDEATSNDDRPIPDSTLQEALNLCLRDPSNISKVVRSCVTKLTNSFVMVRIKALGILLHLAKHGPPDVATEIAANFQAILACQNWRGEPHPVRGFEPYDVMREAVQLLLNFTREGSGTRPRFMRATSPAIPSSLPARSTSITTPYPTQTPADPSPSVQQPPYLNYPGPQQQTAPAHPGYSQPAHPAQEAAPGLLSGAVDTVSSFFKKAFSKRGDFTAFSDVAPPQPGAPAAGDYPPYTYVGSDGFGPQAQPRAGPVYDRDNVSGTSLVDEFDGSGVSRSSARSRERQVKPKKPVIRLSPAKKLLKVTGGRAMANADELRAFRDSLTVESIAELAEGLTHEEWKVRVRAILGLELCGERYGLQAVAHIKSEVLSLTGAPQASLRTAATRFHNAIKLVAPGSPTEEKSAFSFIEDAVHDAGEPPEAGNVIIVAEPEPEPEAEQESKAQSKQEDEPAGTPDEARAPAEAKDEEAKPAKEEEEEDQE